MSAPCCPKHCPEPSCPECEYCGVCGFLRCHVCQALASHIVGTMRDERVAWLVESYDFCPDFVYEPLAEAGVLERYGSAPTLYDDGTAVVWPTYKLSAFGERLTLEQIRDVDQRGMPSRREREAEDAATAAYWDAVVRAGIFEKSCAKHDGPGSYRQTPYGACLEKNGVWRSGERPAEVAAV